MARAEHHNVVDLFTGLPLADNKLQRILRLSPELDGMCMLYSNKANGNKLFSMKLACWALRQDGSVEGMVPWLNQLHGCSSMVDPDIGLWEGYYDPHKDDIFYEAPMHKALELETAVEFFGDEPETELYKVQEIADTIGTHALLIDPLKQHLTLSEVVSWRLTNNGSVDAMLINEEQVTSTPVLAGDPCLYAAADHPEFHYFFQHHVANQIKCEEPSAMAAVALLLDR